MHAIVGFTGATMVKKGMAFPLVLLAMAPLHGVLEALIVVPFGFDLYRAGVVVGIGTVLHHLVDSAIALAVLPLLRGAGIFANGRVRSS
jgi:niacin transporter